jgi:hypothetical protein
MGTVLAVHHRHNVGGGDAIYSVKITTIVDID